MAGIEALGDYQHDAQALGAQPLAEFSGPEVLPFSGCVSRTVDSYT
ncbi:hypothetical protein [Mycolicibacterium sarraceniae]|nr:hypothetical protein [Mycolicibacterium sarraceniae]